MDSHKTPTNPVKDGDTVMWRSETCTVVAWDYVHEELCLQGENGAVFKRGYCAFLQTPDGQMVDGYLKGDDA